MPCGSCPYREEGGGGGGVVGELLKRFGIFSLFMFASKFV